MKFYEITENDKVFPGEYVLHVPSNQVVLCGSFDRMNNKMRVLANGRMMIDSISNFRKIQANKKDRQKMRRCRRCKGK